MAKWLKIAFRKSNIKPGNLKQNLRWLHLYTTADYLALIISSIRTMYKINLLLVRPIRLRDPRPLV